MSYVDDDAFTNDNEKSAKDDQRLIVRFSLEKRLNQAMMTRIGDINAEHERLAELMDVAGKFDEAKAERAKKLPDDPVYRDIEFIFLQVPGQRDAIHRPVFRADKIRFRAKYEAWKNGLGAPVEGTPIDQLPEIKPSQVKDLTYMNITTIEALAGVPDGSPLFQMMGSRSLKNRAQAWVAKNRRATDVAAPLNAALAERDAQIAKLQEQMEALIAANIGKPAKVATK